MNNENQNNILDNIKHYIEDGEMSFLIGAGFSRNVNKEAYPLWGELLKDAIWDMFGNGDRATQEGEVRAKAEKEFGYLGIASMMVKRFGYHEAIDTYIESKTPFLKTDNGKPMLFLKGDPMAYQVNQTCHNLLKNLEIHNIYTFNYDNALEFFMGDEARKKLESDIFKQEEEIEECYKIIEGHKKEKAAKEEQLISLKNEKNYSKGERPVKKNDDTEDYDSLKKELESIKKKITGKEHELRELRVNLDINEEKRKSFYNVVKEAHEISLSSRQKSIYKIHGSLRESKDAKYGFDGDTHTQYIITQEDYETYPEKHEAFMNMMRIDLLRSRFCIIGVSGGDANFLLWINWVKDILDKTNDREKHSSNKRHLSYFIYSGDNDISEEMELMLKNHYIQPVILKDLFPLGKNDEDRITLFLKYLQPLRNEGASSLTNLWSSIEVHNWRHKKAEPIEIDKAEELLRLSQIHKFHKPMSAAHYTALSIQSEANYYLGEKANDPERMVYAAAIECSMLPIDLSCKKEHIEKIKKEPEKDIKEIFQNALNRVILLQNLSWPSNILDIGDQYSKILFNLFNFQFPKCEDVLSITNKKGVDFVRKYSLLCLLEYDTTKAENCEASDFNTPQEFILATDWLKYLGYKNPAMFSKADNLKHQNRLFSLHDYCQAYLRAMRKKEEIYPYGNVTKTIYLDKYTSDVTNAAILLNSFIELGICFDGHYLLSDQEWLEIVRALKTRYTNALIFYTICRNSPDKTIKLVAQEMMYTETSRQKLAIVLNNILSSLISETTPNTIRAKMATFATEILPAVNVIHWSKRFDKNVDKLLEIADQFGGHSPITKSIYRFVEQALGYVKAKDLKVNLLKRIFDREIEDDIFGSQYNGLAIAAKKGLTSKDFSPLYNNFITFAKKVKKTNSRQGYFIVINLIVLLSPDQKFEILKLLEDQALKDSNMTEGYISHIKDYPELASAFKKVFLEQDDLWKTGISKEGVSFGFRNVRVSLADKWLRFNETEVLTVYMKIKNVIRKIVKALDRNGNLIEDLGWISAENNFREIVIDMLLFIKHHNKQLKRLEGYNDTCKTINDAYERCFFRKSIYQLISDDEIYRAIRRIMTETEIFGIDSFSQEYAQLVGRLIAKDSNDLGVVFQHIAWIINDRKIFFNTDDFRKLLGNVLIIYTPYFDSSKNEIPNWDLPGCQKEIAEDCLIKIAKTLESMGSPNEFWKNYERVFTVA